LADDDEDFRGLLARRLVAQGYVVVEAEDGDELLGLLVNASIPDADRALGYDAIITDIVMPGFSGLDVLRAFRRAAASSAVIVMSGFDDARYATTARSLGAAFFPKPFDSAELVQLLAKALEFVA
jgi:DNA-binding response OmpR family regulator